MEKICVGGGQFRSSLFQRLEEWESCKRAMLVEIDPVTKRSRQCVEYDSPKEAAAGVLAAVERGAVPAGGATHSTPGRLRENARPAS